MNIGQLAEFSLVLYVVVAIVLFLIFRAVVLWYWKVHEQVALLKEIRDSLHQLVLQSNDGMAVRVPSQAPLA